MAESSNAVDLLRAALQFYARHEHWMTLTSDADALRTSLVAMKGDGIQHGWRVAEDALAAHDAAVLSRRSSAETDAQTNTTGGDEK